MNNITKKILLSTAILGATASFVAPSEVHASGSKLPGINFGEKGIIPIENANLMVQIEGKQIVPIVYRMTRDHKDYNFYRSRGMHVGGVVYLYIQEDEGIYYYSPILRYFDDKGSTSPFNKKVQTKLTQYGIYPQYSHPKTGYGNYMLALNNASKDGGGAKTNESLSKIAKSIKGLHHTNSGVVDYNFRAHTMKNAFYYPWNITSISPTRSSATKRYKHSDGSWKYGEYRELGYNLSGRGVFNPSFPVDGVAGKTSGKLQDYPLLPYPWAHPVHRNRVDSNGKAIAPDLLSTTDEKVYQYAIHTGMINWNETIKINGKNVKQHKVLYNNSGIKWTKAIEEEFKELYNQKWYIMADVYDRFPNIRNNVKLKNLSRSNAIQAMTIRYISLGSDPYDDVNLSIALGREPIRLSGVGQYYYSLALVAPDSNTESIQHTVIRKQVVKNQSGKILQTFTRSANGTNVSVKNHTSDGSIPKVSPGEKLTVETTVDIENKFRNLTLKPGQLKFRTSMNTSEDTVTLPGNARAKSGSTFSKTITVPSSKQGQYDIYTELDELYYNRTQDMMVGKGTNTAYSSIEVVPDEGDFQQIGIDLIDRSNRVVQNPIPGHEYKVRYKYRYRGSVSSNTSRWADVYLSSHSIEREMRNPSLWGQEQYNFGRLNPTTSKDTSGARPYSLYNNKEFQFETDYHVYETGQMDTDVRLVADVRDTITRTELVQFKRELFDGLFVYDYEYRTRYDYYQFGLNNGSGKEWSSQYDLGIQNLSVIPGDIENAQKQKGIALVKFDIDYKTPSFVSNLGQDVEIQVKVGDKVVQTTEHVRKGLNRNITVPVEIDYPDSNSLVNAEVIVNPNKLVYEDDNNVVNLKDTNNYSQANSIVKRPNVVPFRDNNREESWNQYVERNNWTGQKVDYRSFSGANLSFNRFTTADNVRTESQRFSEEYKIDAVRFRSRLTKQEGMGNDGWIDLMQGDGYIRAGYGYELEIDVSYNTDAKITNFENRTGTNGAWTRPGFAEPLLQDNIYIQMPDGKIRSAQGDSGTEKALRLKESSGSGLDKKWTFEIDGGTALGVNTTGRFYFGDRVKDGRYNLNVFTPKIRGVNGKMTNSTTVLEHLLYDSQPDLHIEVIGAHVDDISDHINK